jgi:hypothetical protein
MVEDGNWETKMKKVGNRTQYFGIVSMTIGSLLMLGACGGGGGSANNAGSSNTAGSNAGSTSNQSTATSYSLSGTVSGSLASGQSLTVLVNGNVQATLTASGSFNLGTVPANSDYSVTLQSGWSGSNLATGSYCYVQNGLGTASANVTDISIQCGPAPTKIYLGGTQNTVSYYGWTLSYPTVANGELYYEVTLGTSGPAQETMTSLLTLFDGTGASAAMNASGDPSAIASGYASNVTTLQTTSLVENGGTTSTAIPLKVAIPTLTQLQNFYSANNYVLPVGWVSTNYWSSTISAAGWHYAPTPASAPSATPSSGADSSGFYVALQVQ